MPQQRKVALVTGAGTGIGRAVALGLSAAGYDVALIGRRQNLLDDVAQSAAGRALAIASDVGRPSAVRAAFEEAARAFGRLDLLFNNAGLMGSPCAVDEYEDDYWESIIRTNVTGAFYCAREAFRLMRAQTPQGGRIINNGSLSAHSPRPLSIAYTTSKHAVTGLTKSLSLDGRPYNIACGQIDIGNAATEMTARIQKGIRQPDGALRSEPTMRLDNVVQAILFMDSLPLESNVQFTTVMATAMPFIGRG